MSPAAEARRRLLARARRELPEPGDPRLLCDDLLAAGLAGPEALQVLARTSLAHVELRELRLARGWQRAYGWFLARNLMLLGLLVLLLTLLLRPPLLALEGALAGAALYYLLVLCLAPARLRPLARRRQAILAAYAKDLGDYLDSLER